MLPEVGGLFSTLQAQTFKCFMDILIWRFTGTSNSTVSTTQLIHLSPQSCSSISTLIHGATPIKYRPASVSSPTAHMSSVTKFYWSLHPSTSPFCPHGHCSDFGGHHPSLPLHLQVEPRVIFPQTHRGWLASLLKTLRWHSVHPPRIRFKHQ